jgi:hypothetical protein
MNLIASASPFGAPASWRMVQRAGTSSHSDLIERVELRAMRVSAW